MIIVLVGIMLQIAEDGWLAPSSLLFFIVTIQLIVAGILHPQEWTCLLCGVIYYITVPSMYMLLIIFSIFNVHNVTWGTREKKNIPQEKKEPSTVSNSRSLIIGKENKQNKNQNGSLEFSLGNLFKCICCIYSQVNHEEIRLSEINESLLQIEKHLKLLDRVANQMEINNVGQSSNANGYIRPYFSTEDVIEEELHQEIGLQCMINDNRNEHETGDIDEDSDILTQMSATSSHEHSSFLISPYWLQDERMRMGEVDFLSNSEEEFWKDLIEKYLRPIDADKESQDKVAQELMDCRDAYLLKFFMINALFVLIVFLMQLNKETLHLQWPLGMKYNVTYDAERNEIASKYIAKPAYIDLLSGFVSNFALRSMYAGFAIKTQAYCGHRWHRICLEFLSEFDANLVTICYQIVYWVHLTKQYLRLEPIGCLFIIGFISILAIQFIAMLIHRFDTFTHVLANKKIELPYCTKITSSDSIYAKNADEIAQSLLHMAEEDIFYELRRTTMIAPSRRTMYELTENVKMPSRMMNFEKLFRRKLHDPNGSGLLEHISSRISRSAFNAFEQRRSSILERRRTQTQKSYDVIYNDADNLGRPSKNQVLSLQTISSSRQSNSNQFHYNNPGFKQDENV